VLYFVDLMLIDEFTSLDEPADVSVVAMIAAFAADGPDFIGFARRAEHIDLTRKLKLPIIGSIS
jgi:hypothetical protein